jgi:ABC-type phosphate transport system permease subunit
MFKHGLLSLIAVGILTSTVSASSVVPVKSEAAVSPEALTKCLEGIKVLLSKHYDILAGIAGVTGFFAILSNTTLLGALFTNEPTYDEDGDVVKPGISRTALRYVAATVGITTLVSLYHGWYADSVKGAIDAINPLLSNSATAL